MPDQSTGVCAARTNAHYCGVPELLAELDELRGKRASLSLYIATQSAVQAVRLLRRVETQLAESRADWNEDRFRRLMRVRWMAVRRLRRRWETLNPRPLIPLGNLRRRYHANMAAYLNTPDS